MLIEDQGTVVLFIPQTDEEADWLEENTNAEPWQYLGQGLVVDHRMAPDLLQAVSEAGFYRVEYG